ncbi:hypothetical protein KIW84_070229 [Lathyrus oleraceus]|uniref:Uncharacterized protein n=1 Tax=Pisum sativum TaxID=3888 RepID=A0A9D4VF59_PEA|nr:hypothetical protein KIW84_070229 [Pisum sativum]
MLDEMHVEAKGKAFMGSSKKLFHISRKNDTSKEVAEVKNSMSTESSSWEDSSRSDVSDSKTQEMIRIWERVIVYFPRYVTKNYLWWNQKVIKIIDCDNGDRYYREVHYAKRKNKAVKLEKFNGKGWYKYMKKKKKLCRGDKVGFTIRNPLDRLFLYIIKRKQCSESEAEASEVAVLEYNMPIVQSNATFVNNVCIRSSLINWIPSGSTIVSSMNVLGKYLEHSIFFIHGDDARERPHRPWIICALTKLYNVGCSSGSGISTEIMLSMSGGVGCLF